MELSLFFIILAVILIFSLIGYSIWAAKQEKSKMFENDFSNRPAQPINLQQETTKLNQEVNISPSLTQSFSEAEQAPLKSDIEQNLEQSVNKIKIKLNNQDDVVEEPQAEDIQPSLFVNQDFEEQEEIIEENSESKKEKEEQIITLYLVAPENQIFNGLELIHKLEEIGLQYGEHKLFHRHIDNAASPVIFSVANMMQPGVFDLNNVDSLEVVGLVFFMYIPSSGNDVANLRLMISTVESLSKSLGGFVLNEKRALFDEQSHLEYIQRVQ